MLPTAEGLAPDITTPESCHWPWKTPLVDTPWRTLYDLDHPVAIITWAKGNTFPQWFSIKSMVSIMQSLWLVFLQSLWMKDMEIELYLVPYIPSICISYPFYITIPLSSCLKAVGRTPYPILLPGLITLDTVKGLSWVVFSCLLMVFVTGRAFPVTLA